MKKIKILLSGGGTGGHIFPAIAIAQELKKRLPSAEFLFIGATSRMEMKKVPEQGFPIIGVDMVGISRTSILKNIFLPIQLAKSLWKVRRIIRDFRPDFAIGTGGYCSGPALFMASMMGIPTFIQEQNAFAGITNKILGKKARAIFTAYPAMDRFFDVKKTFCFGNPVRQEILQNTYTQQVAREKLGIDPAMFTVFSVGGSLGAQSINKAWENNLNLLQTNNIQLLWQTGESDFSRLNEKGILRQKNIYATDFVQDMLLYYSAADLVLSRAGAIALSELSILEKPSLLAPYPKSAENHQLINAQCWAEKGGAILILDENLEHELPAYLLDLLKNEQKMQAMKASLSHLRQDNALVRIVDKILEIMGLQSSQE